MPEIHEILIDRALEAAKAAAPEFQNKVEKIAKKYEAIITPVNLKTKDSLVRKINSYTKQSIGTTFDLVRNTIIVRDSDDIPKILNEIQKQFIVPTDKGKLRIKDQSTPLGYTGSLINVQLKGVTGEIQVNTPQMIYAKDENARDLLPKDVFEKIEKQSGLKCGLGHKYYEEWRLPTTSAERKRELEKISKKYYEAIRKVTL